MSKKKRRLVWDEIPVEGRPLVEIIEEVDARGGTLRRAVIQSGCGDFSCDCARVLLFQRPETKAERKARKNPEPPQALVFKASDPLANLGATAPPEPGFIVSDTMPRGVPNGTIWINTGPEVTEPIEVDETPPSTTVSRYVWWPAAVIALLAVLYVVFLLVAAWRHS